MSGHSKWATTKHKKAKVDSQRAVVFQKFSREIIVASRLGGGDLKANFRLRTAVEKAKEQGYVETLFNRRRYIPELKSNNYMVRQFGERAAMNTPIQGTAADIMKIAMINVYKKLIEENLDAKIVLQVHDEMMIEAPLAEAEKVKEIVKTEMEGAIKLNVPLIAEVSEAENWYECK